MRVNLRDDVSSQGTAREEREANAFAAELLMPEAEVAAQIRKVLERGGTDSQFIADLRCCLTSASRQWNSDSSTWVFVVRFRASTSLSQVVDALRWVDDGHAAGKVIIVPGS